MYETNKVKSDQKGTLYQTIRWVILKMGVWNNVQIYTISERSINQSFVFTYDTVPLD